MRLAHISDLHIGKRVNEISQLADQQYILDQIISVISENHVDAVLIAGDVYDKTMPSAEAVALCDDFLTKLSATGKHVFIISGNHDCEERVAFAGRIMERMNIHIAPVFDGQVSKYSLDENTDVYLLPFIKPIGIKQYYPGCEINNHNDAVRTVLEHTEINKNHCNILVAHQFVTGAERSESEEVYVGGLDNVDASLFKDFDYVALGHIHKPQHISRESIRYCGSPLKYSFSEANHIKSVTIADVEFGKVAISEIPLTPLHDMRDISGNFQDILNNAGQDGLSTTDYIRIILTDEEDIPDAIRRLRSVYPNIMRLEYNNKRTKTYNNIMIQDRSEDKSSYELFAELYQLQNNSPLSPEQSQYVKEILEEVFG